MVGTTAVHRKGQARTHGPLFMYVTYIYGVEEQMQIPDVLYNIYYK